MSIKNIIIYPHRQISLADGGTTVQYELAKILSELGLNVKIFSIYGETHNDIFNNFTSDKNYNKEDTIVIYCEAIPGNPLDSKYVVRWMLSPLGTNVPQESINQWSKNELVYYFNSEKKFELNHDLIGNIYKTLTCIYISPLIKNKKNHIRTGYCHTRRKIFMHKNGVYIHPSDSFEITRQHSQEDYVKIFNEKEIFISYDPLTFMSIIATMCGCVSVVVKLEGYSSQSDWLQTLYVGQYVKEKKIERLYGIAYGIDELGWARDTIHLVEDQWKDIMIFLKEKTIIPFLEDLKNIETLKNTVEHNFF